MYIKPFSELSKGDAAIAGGKGASLGEMTNAGVPVPPGFVVLSDAFEKFLEETDLNVEIDSILHGVDTKAMHTIEHASETIQKLILEARMPEDIAREILDNFKKLDARFVAVRSSATAEDSASAAWAGQLDSFLNTTEESLLKNVQRCWASLFTPRAIFYRFEQGLHESKISVAVVVQKMVESEVSGIAFSVHPVTEDYNQLIIEAGFGLGEAIVSGQITPDSYVVEKEPRRIVDVNVSEQERGIYRKSSNGENEWQSIPVEKRNQQKLSNEQILELSEIILHIEKHYGFPCDIEWAFEGGKFYIVQSRPITTLTPLVVSLAPDVLKSEDYTYVGYYKCSIFANWFWTAWYSDELARKIDLKIDFGGYTGYAGGHSSLHKQTIQQLGDVLHAKIKKGDLRYFDEIVVLADDEFASAMRFADSIQIEKDTIQGTFEEVVTHARRMMFFWWIGWQFSEIFDETLKNEAMKLGISEGDISASISQPDTPLIRQQAEVKKLKGVLEERGIWELLKRDVASAIEKITESPDLNVQFKNHIEKYEWIQMINWVGDKLTLEKLLEQMTYLKTEEEKIKMVIPDSFKPYADVASRISYIRQAGAEYSSMFENKALPVLEALAKEGGVSVRDMLNLLPEEFFSGPNLSRDIAEKIEKRKKDKWFIYVDRDNSIKSIEDTDTADTLAKSFIPIAEEGNSNELRGNIGNKGKAIGPVRVILATDDFHKMQEGDVLVTPMTTPDFVLLMQKSSAIVTDMGGLLCHAAIVSRELNKPCIIGTNFGTQVLHDGDLVEVDADNGVVRILERAEGKKIPVYEKIFSRDFCLPLVEAWCRAESTDPRIWTEKQQPKVPYIIFERKGDAVDCYMDNSGVDWIKQELAELVSRDPGYVQFAADRFVESTKLMVEIWKKEEISDLQELKAYLKNLRSAWVWFEAVWWLMELFHDNEEQIKKLMPARLATEKIGDGSDALIKDALRKIFPHQDDLVDYLLIEEIESENIPSRSELEERKNGYIYTNARLIVGGSIKDVEDEFGIKVNERSGDSLRQKLHISGKSAYGGITRGKARIILSKKQIPSLENGEILVTAMTTPDFLPALQKAAAFITDEGGITCHAAIVARELKKPCIIGTKIATQVLKDGDLVEVDADNGVVRILERASKEEILDKVILKKNYSRDLSLILEQLWVSGFKRMMLQYPDYKNPYEPYVVFFVNGENMEIWENEQSIHFFQDWLLEKNKQGTDFLQGIIHEYEKLVVMLEGYWRDGGVSDHVILKKYLEISERAAGLFFVWYYTGTDDRMPKTALKMARDLREKDEFFAKNDKYIKECVVALGGKAELANLIFVSEFPEIPSEDELRQRVSGVVVVDGDKEYFSSLLQFSEDYPKYEFEGLRTVVDLVDEFSGWVAQRGRVKGIVRIVKNKRNVERVHVGDIIVSPMTTPDFLPAMKKASAFITDEGGITCHAAIVARELKKPCIIGTKIATQVLKDGDLVEVDADNGVVRVLEK